MSRSALFSARLPNTTQFNTTGAKTSVKGTPHFETPNLTPILMNEKSMMTNPQIIGRACKVAARLYYPPSPELTTPGSSFSDRRPRSLFLSGIDKRVSFSTTVPEDSALLASTPGLAHSNLFLPTTTATKPPKPETSYGAPPPLTSTDIGAPGSFDLSEETVVRKGGSEEEEGIQDILELLCVMGAAHRRLCQVRVVYDFDFFMIFIACLTMVLFPYAVSMQRSVAHLSTAAARAISHWLGSSSDWPRLF